jgi:hypothetical protein
VQIADDLSGLEIHPREVVCDDCHLIHWGPTGPSACEFR